MREFFDVMLRHFVAAIVDVMERRARLTADEKARVQNALSEIVAVWMVRAIPGGVSGPTPTTTAAPHECATCAADRRARIEAQEIAREVQTARVLAMRNRIAMLDRGPNGNVVRPREGDEVMVPLDFPNLARCGVVVRVDDTSMEFEGGSRCLISQAHVVLAITNGRDRGEPVGVYRAGDWVAAPLHRNAEHYKVMRIVQIEDSHDANGFPRVLLSDGTQAGSYELRLLMRDGIPAAQLTS